MSHSTIWRILDRDALKPWQCASWLFPRDPQFAEKAERVLDLYAGRWDGRPLLPRDCIISADEKTSIQAWVRCHPAAPPRPGQPRRVEHEYDRGGALAYLAAWDARRGGVIGRCEAKTGKAPFGRLVDQVMQQEPYRSAPRVFWIVDNGSSHRGRPRPATWRRATRVSSWSICRPTSPGSTRSRETSPSSSARCSPRTTSRHSPRLNNGSWPSRRCITTRHGASTGASPASAWRSASLLCRRPPHQRRHRRPPPQRSRCNPPPNPTRIYDMEH